MIIDRVPTRGFRLVFVDLFSHPNQEYLKAHNLLGSELITKLDPQSRLDYNLRLTPETILISPEGRIERVWMGLLGASQIREIDQIVRTDAAVAR